MQTPDPAVAEEWFDTMAVAGVEGLMIKPADSPYVSGARVWLKYKSRQTTDAVIGGVTGSLHRPAALLLGRYASDTGRLHYAGRTTHLTDAQAAAVTPLLVAAIGGHPWPAQLTVNWRSKPTGYHQVAPLVVVEIRADIAADQGRRWRHAVRMLRVRDIAPNEVPLDLDLETENGHRPFRRTLVRSTMRPWGSGAGTGRASTGTRCRPVGGARPWRTP
ncbi:hypothetical protein GCM10023317_28660 [Actinopolymorpha pittospori]|uniref:ATP-dependent DNA ligase n=2 Tax=Actinopolymorpha pittospori TaxID=648752 RepID=A0A927RPH1_9ACTN|nr:ATP-dependent DNA ligase [Actinopolymorpha pittospori]